MVAGARPQFDDLRTSHSDYLRPRSRHLPDLYLSKDTVDRALEVANTVYLTLEDRGHRVMFAPRHRSYSRPPIDERMDGRKNRDPHRDEYGVWYPDSATVVFIGSVAIGLTIFEISERVEMRWTKKGYVRADQLPRPTRWEAENAYGSSFLRDTPSGRLCVRATSPYWRTKWEKLWPETKPGQLPHKARSIVRELEVAAPEIARLVEEAEREAEFQRQRWEVERLERERQEAEKRRLKNIEKSRLELVALIEVWGVAKRVEDFFLDAERRVTQVAAPEEVRTMARLSKARGLLGSVDALERFRDWKAPEERSSPKPWLDAEEQLDHFGKSGPTPN
jgi:hypothetical protein